jgi:cell division protein ZapA
MPLVNVLLNGRAYTLACDEGEQAHVRELGQFLDKRVRELSSSVGQVGDARLLLMAGLTIADELSESLGRMEERDKEIAALKTATPQAGTDEGEDRIAEMLENAALRLEAIAAKFAKPVPPGEAAGRS